MKLLSAGFENGFSPTKQPDRTRELGEHSTDRRKDDPGNESASRPGNLPEEQVKADCARTDKRKRESPYEHHPLCEAYGGYACLGVECLPPGSMKVSRPPRHPQRGVKQIGADQKQQLADVRWQQKTNEGSQFLQSVNHSIHLLPLPSQPLVLGHLRGAIIYRVFN